MDFHNLILTKVVCVSDIHRIFLIFRSEKLNSFSKGGESLLDPEWVRLANFLQEEWIDLLSDLIRLVQPRAEEKNLALISPETSMDDLDVGDLSESAHKWLTDTAASIENADASLLDHVRLFYYTFISLKIVPPHLMSITN